LNYLLFIVGYLLVVVDGCMLTVVVLLSFC